MAPVRLQATSGERNTPEGKTVAVSRHANTVRPFLIAGGASDNGETH